MHLREASGRGGLVALALALALLPSCSSGPAPVPRVIVDETKPAAELRRVLESIAKRDDYEALWARARIHARLRDLEPAAALEHLILADAADVELLSRVAPPEYKSESALRLSRHFRERAANAALCRISYPGKAGDALRDVALLTAAAFLGEYASKEAFADALEALSAAEADLARHESMGSEGQQHWRDRSREALRRAALVREAERAEPSAESRKFCEYGAQRHLEEGTRAADFGTREKAARRELEGVVGWYVLALAHFAVVRETVVEPSAAQQHALAVQEIVVRSVFDLLCRQ